MYPSQASKLTPREPVQRSKTQNPVDHKVYSSYQIEFGNRPGTSVHGNPINRSGNDAYLNPHAPYTISSIPQTKKPFLSPAYRNLTSENYISKRVGDGYSNNYRTSSENISLHRPIYTAPSRTKLNYLFQHDTKSVAPVDRNDLYKHNYLDMICNDHFVSDKWLKTETMNLRDVIACLMEMADYMRNMSFNVNSRGQFGADSATGQNQLDLFGQKCTKLNGAMEELLLSYNKLNSNALELKRMTENFVFAEHVIDKNLWDRGMRPLNELSAFKATEDSIRTDKTVFRQQKVQGNRVLEETHGLMNRMEALVHKDLEDLMEEGKVLIMHRLFNREYQAQYMRDSNGYIKETPKKPLSTDEWFSRTESVLGKIQDLKSRADKQTESVIGCIEQVAKTIQEQWQKTHDVAGDQVESALKTQSKLMVDQYDTKQELAELQQAMSDATRKMNHMQLANEYELTELEGKLKQSKIDPYFNNKRDTQIKYANQMWSGVQEMRHNVNNMTNYRDQLASKSARLGVDLHSNHTGVNYDLRTIVEPRRFQAGANPSLGMVNRSLSVFN